MNKMVMQHELHIAASTSWPRNVGIVLAGTLFMAICAHLSVPLIFTPVPLSLAPLPVLVLGLMLSPRLAASTLIVYLLEGAAGLPVFSPHGIGGIAQLFGPTGGYLLCYPLAATVIALLWRRTNRSFSSGLLCAAVGSLLILASGAIWLTLYTHSSLAAVLPMSVYPFLPGDILKIAAASAISAGFTRLTSKQA